MVEARTFNAFFSRNLDKYVRLLDYVVNLYKHGLETTQAAASLYALVVVMLQQFICYRRTRQRYTLLASPDAPASQCAGLGVAQTMAARGFGFFPAGVINWATLEINESLLPRLVVPQLAVATRWRTDTTMRQT